MAALQIRARRSAPRRASLSLSRGRAARADRGCFRLTPGLLLLMASNTSSSAPLKVVETIRTDIGGETAASRSSTHLLRSSRAPVVSQCSGALLPP